MTLVVSANDDTTPKVLLLTFYPQPAQHISILLDRPGHAVQTVVNTWM